VLSATDLQALWLTLALAGLTTLILLLGGTPLAWWLAHRRSRRAALLESLLALPLVLPPTVLGFYLLLLFSPRHGPGHWWQAVTGHTLAFSFTGILIASVIYSLPFVVQPLVTGFRQQGVRYLQAAATLGATPWQRWWSVALPMNRPHLIMAASLGFAHTLGEFGVVLMVGGSIPGVTRVLSVALFEHVEAGEMIQAHVLAGLLLAAALGVMLLVNTFRRRGAHVVL